MRSNTPLMNTTKDYPDWAPNWLLYNLKPVKSGKVMWRGPNCCSANVLNVDPSETLLCQCNIHYNNSHNAKRKPLWNGLPLMVCFPGHKQLVSFPADFVLSGEMYNAQTVHSICIFCTQKNCKGYKDARPIRVQERISIRVIKTWFICVIKAWFILFTGEPKC